MNEQQSIRNIMRLFTRMLEELGAQPCLVVAISEPHELHWLAPPARVMNLFEQKGMLEAVLKEIERRIASARN